MLRSFLNKLLDWELCLHPLVFLSPYEAAVTSQDRSRGLPGGPLGKNLPGNAGEVSSIPDQETKIPRAAEQRSLRATTVPAHRT